ncbi:MAG: outer membrane lipoprotein-sorting protein [Bdellovibrionota bacterium]
MNKRTTVLTAVAVSLQMAGTAQTSHAALSAKEIMTRNEEARKIQDVTSRATLKTGGGQDKEKLKEFTWWKKIKSDNIHYNTLTRFHKPAEIRNEGILFLEHDNNENEVLLYLPNFKKIRRVEAQQQSSSFMGSVFSYSDITTPHVEDYAYKLLREETCPGGEAALKCSVIESVPASDSVRDRTRYSRTVQWIRPDNFMMAQAEYYDLEGALIKRALFSKIDQVDPARNKWMAKFIRMDNVKTAKFTELEFSQVKANTGLKDALFTQQNLSRVP